MNKIVKSAVLKYLFWSDTFPKRKTAWNSTPSKKLKKRASQLGGPL
jgi:hypothetical protein